MNKFILILAFISVLNIAKAQIKLDSVLITANKYEQRLDQTGKSLIIISSEEIANNGGLNTSELLQKHLGILVNGAGQTLGSNQTLYLQGSDAGQTLILINGVPIQDPSNIEGNYDLNLISLIDIERIEILKGGQSTLYGSNATAGTINFITKNNNRIGTNYDLFLNYGSFSTLNTGLNFNVKNQNSKFNFGFNSSLSKGFSSAKDTTGNNNFDKDGFKRAGFNFDYQQKIKKLRLDFNGRFTAISSDLDWAAFIDDKSYTSKSKNIIFSTRIFYPINQGELILNYRINSINRNYLKDSTFINTDPYSPKYSNSDYNSTANYIEGYFHSKINKNCEIIGGIDYNRQNLNQTYISYSSYGKFEDTPLLKDSTKVYNTSAYFNSSLKLFNLIGLEVGLRYNYNNFYKSFLSYNFNPFYEINDELKVFAILSNSYKNPSLYQLYSPYGNKDLRPEKGKDFRIGGTYVKKAFSMQFEIFNKILNQKFFFMNFSSFPYGQYVNLNEVKINGIELAVEYNYKNFGINTNYIGMKPNQKSNFLRRSNNQFNFIFNYKINEKMQASLNLNLIGKRQDSYYNNGVNETIILKKVSLLNADFNYQIIEKVKLFMNVQNILNVNYYEIYGYNTKPINFNLGLIFR